MMVSPGSGGSKSLLFIGCQLFQLNDCLTVFQILNVYETKFKLVVNKVKVNPRKSFIELESILFHAMFQDHHTSGSEYYHM